MSAPRAALYARVSTDEQNPELQVAELRRLAEQRGWRVVDEYIDHSVSGAKESRPAPDRLLADQRLTSGWPPADRAGAGRGSAAAQQGRWM